MHKIRFGGELNLLIMSKATVFTIVVAKQHIGKEH